MKNSYVDAFIKRTFRMLNSPAFRSLSLSAHRVLSRIELELGRHAGKDNGKLAVTRENFHEYGIESKAVNAALRELDALGFIEITQRGHIGKAGQRRPNLYRLTYLPCFGEDPTNEWATVLTIEDAERIARNARSSAKNSPRPGNSNEGGKPPFPRGENHPVTLSNEGGKPPIPGQIHRGEKPPTYLDILATPLGNGSGATEPEAVAPNVLPLRRTAPRL